MQVNVKKLHESALLPAYATAGAACFDLHACLPDGAALSTLDHPTVFLPTGLAFEIPEGYVMRIYSRSGHGFKENTRLANCVGVIDSDYRGEVVVKLTRDDSGSLMFFHGDRIAQAEIAPVLRVGFEEVEELSETERGANGLGSTGTRPLSPEVAPADPYQELARSLAASQPLGSSGLDSCSSESASSYSSSDSGSSCSSDSY